MDIEREKKRVAKGEPDSLTNNIQILKDLLLNFKKNNKISDTQLLEILTKILLKKEQKLPISIFNAKLGTLESIVKCMKENLGLKNSEIAKILKRNDRTIWATYANSKKKHPQKFECANESLIPVLIFSHREAGALEILTIYMHDNLGMTFTEIARKTGRDPRTIWSSYTKGKKKYNG